MVVTERGRVRVDIQRPVLSLQVFREKAEAQKSQDQSETPPRERGRDNNWPLVLVVAAAYCPKSFWAEMRAAGKGTWIGHPDEHRARTELRSNEDDRGPMAHGGHPKRQGNPRLQNQGADRSPRPHRSIRNSRETETHRTGSGEGRELGPCRPAQGLPEEGAAERKEGDPRSRSTCHMPCSGSESHTHKENLQPEPASWQKECPTVGVRVPQVPGSSPTRELSCSVPTATRRESPPPTPQRRLRNLLSRGGRGGAWGRVPPKVLSNNGTLSGFRSHVVEVCQRTQRGRRPRYRYRRLTRSQREPPSKTHIANTRTHPAPQSKCVCDYLGKHVMMQSKL